jgi:hypothetical protein
MRVGNILTKEHQESDAEQNQDVGHVRDVCVVEKLHLLFRGSHEHEAPCNEQERRHVLEAVGIRAIGCGGASIFQDERDLDNTSRSCRHQRIPKNGVDHGRDREMLRMRGHGPAGHEDHNTRNEVPLRPSVSCAAQPNADQTSCPPYDTHGGVLQVVVAPFLSPAVLGEGVDAAPSSDHERVEEFLAPSGTPQPNLSNQEQDDKHDSVGDKGAAHDEMSQTLSGVVGPAESKRCDAAKDKLHPGNNRHCLANKSVCPDYDPPYLCVDALLEVELQIDAHGDLRNQHEHDVGHELSVEVVGKLPALVLMAEEVSNDCEEGAEGLYGNVPFRADYLSLSVLAPPNLWALYAHPQYHSGGEYDTPCESLYQDMYPQYRVLRQTLASRLP